MGAPLYARSEPTTAMGRSPADEDGNGWSRRKNFAHVSPHSTPNRSRQEPGARHRNRTILLSEHSSPVSLSNLFLVAIVLLMPVAGFILTLGHARKAVTRREQR